MSTKPIFLLFDAHALIHRAYHALPTLSLKNTGEPTGAIYGFTSMMLRVINDVKPMYVAVAFDSAAPTFRHIAFKDYKAHREKAADDLIQQFPRVRQLVRVFKIPTFEVDGYEADDILGALSCQASTQGVETIIVTGDSDTMQLVSPDVKVMVPRPQKSFSDTILYDENMVRERYGLSPSQIADFKGLKGDPSDNIKGVPGIGEKTATKLIQRFGSIENIYSNINEVTPTKLKDTLLANKEIALLSKMLTTIKCDVPVKLDLQACRLSSYDKDSVINLFYELQFNSLINKLPQVEEDKPVEHVQAASGNYITIDSEEALDRLVEEIQNATYLAFDTETTGIEPMLDALVGISLSIKPGSASYIPLGHLEGQQISVKKVIEKLQPVFTSSKPKVAHNGKFDIEILSRYGFKVNNLNFDTMIAAHLLGEKNISLKTLSFNKLNIEMTPIKALIGSGSKQLTMSQVPVSVVSDYSCADADMTMRLKDLFEPELKNQNLIKLFTDVEMPLATVLLRMEMTGIAVNTAYLINLADDLLGKIQTIELKIYNDVGHQFNINSPQQLAGVLYDDLRLQPGQGKKRSTEASILEELKDAHPVINSIMEYRQLTKLKSTYVDALPAMINPETKRIHTCFNQTQTTTGRLSSSNPNMQNIPIGKLIRQAFIANKGCLLLAADYSQIDLRVMAHLSQDKRLVSAFVNDEDIHTQTAMEVFGLTKDKVTPQLRRAAKTINFGIIYGMSGYGLEKATDFSREDASRYINAYFEKYPGVKIYHEKIKREAEEKGYVQTILGRRRYIPEIRSSNRMVKSEAERMAINMPVQGTASDIIKIAMIEIQKAIDSSGFKSRMLLQVHDELVFEIPEAELMEMRALVQNIMSNAITLSVPLKVDLKTGKNWGEMD
ncbi:MAG: DNA polymerase I [Chloroflexi bacterium]|nr:DNA polymerase I [Chloroflexota bacterium]